MANKIETMKKGENPFIFTKGFKAGVKKGEVHCPSCGKKGGVRARIDAYADHALTVNPLTKRLNYVYTSTAIMDEVQAYECFECNAELNLIDILAHNQVAL